MRLVDGGRIVTLRAGASPQDVLRADCGDGYRGPRLLTVMLTRRDKQSGADPSVVDAQVTATVKWGCGGVSSTFQADWRDGCSLSIVADEVTVTGSYEGPFLDERRTPDQDVGAVIGEGVRPSNVRATLTRRVGLLTPVAPALVVPIPAKAADVSLSCRLPLSSYPVATLTFLLADAGNPLATVIPASALERFTIPGNCRAVLVSSMLAPADFFTLIFSLDA